MRHFMCDDGRNADAEDMAERIEGLLRVGRRYRITVADDGPAGEDPWGGE
jgi:hypothetical protein